MRDLFPGWVPPDEETLDHYWSEATFAVDTSVLLDLYRFSEEAREGLLQALRSFEERLWIPHQVGLEFHRNRLRVLLDQREAEDNLLRELGQLREDVDSKLSKLLRGAGRRDLAPLRDAIDDGFESLRDKLKEAEQEHTKGLGDSLRDDPIYEQVVGLCGARVGPPFGAKRQAEVLEEAAERFSNKTPPGYLDDEKDERTRYGDVILWYQLCEKAAETGRPVVLIADDQKADWVWEERGKTIGPRPELVAEMQARAGVGFHLYTPTRVLQVWEQRGEGGEVGAEVMAEIEASAEDPDPPAGTWADIVRHFDTWRQLQDTGVSPEVEASHHIDGDTVHLTLDYRPAMPGVGPPMARVAVTSPVGQVAQVQTFPISVSPAELGQAFGYSLRYPGQFSEEGLLPGVYEAVWKIFHTDPKPVARPQWVVADRFTIEPEQAGQGDWRNPRTRQDRVCQSLLGEDLG